MTSVFAKPKYIEAAYPYRFHGSLRRVVHRGWHTDRREGRRRLAENETGRQGQSDSRSGCRSDARPRHRRRRSSTDRRLVEAPERLQARRERPLHRGPSVEGVHQGSVEHPVAEHQEWGPTRKGTRSFFPEHVFVVEDKLPLGVTEPSGIANGSFTPGAATASSTRSTSPTPRSTSPSSPTTTSKPKSGRCSG